MANASKKISVDVELRTDSGKNACRRLRRAGKVPGNVYGLDVAPVAVQVDPRRIEEVLRLESGRNTIFSIGTGQESREVMLRELQRDPVVETLLHVDFVRVDLTKAVHVSVPVRLIGVSEGVKNEGGILDFIHRTVEVACLPGKIPEHYDVDITALHLNQHVSVEDLPAEDGVEILDPPETILAVISAPKAEEEPVVEEGEEEAAAAEGEADAAKDDEGGEKKE